MNKKIEIKGSAVTINDVNNSIINELCVKMGSGMTVCLLVLKNGFEIIGRSGVVDPSNYDYVIGSKIAKDDALDQVWFHLVSILHNQL